jgi:SAM-dependent methyltransferase
MLQHAKQTVDAQGWRNATLVQGDATRLSREQIPATVAEGGDGVDAVISTFALCVIPGWEEALSRAVDVLKPGGRLVVGDVKLSERPLLGSFNLLADLMGGVAADDLGRGPWLHFPDLLADVHFEDCFFGFFYVVSGRKREAQL